MPAMQEAADTLYKFGVSYEVKVLSAHRTPQKTASYARNARKNGIKAIIAGAGGAAHLAGVIAAHTTLPVIGVPMETKSLAGIDSLMSTVQMPAGIPVATMAIGKAGAKNAAVLAVQILSVSDSGLAKKLTEYKKELVKAVLKKVVTAAAMPTEMIRLNPSRPDTRKIKQAASALREGKLVVFPTETVYGIGANAGNKKAILRLRRLKNRPVKPFSFHISTKSDLKKLNCVVDKTAEKLIKRFWPGPLTLVLNTKRGRKIGVRMPSHPVALSLLRNAGVWVVAPSANFKAKQPAATAADAMSDLNGLVDIVIDAGKARFGVSSTVLDLTRRQPKILREGSVTRKMIEKTIGTKA